jgi:hypothetical protein
MTFKSAKALVYLMSILLMTGFLVLVVGLYLGWHDNSQFEQVSKRVVPKGKIFLNQPAGSQIDSVVLDKSQFLLSISGGGIDPRVIVINRLSSRVHTVISIGNSYQGSFEE